MLQTSNILQRRIAAVANGPVTYNRHGEYAAIKFQDTISWLYRARSKSRHQGVIQVWFHPISCNMIYSDLMISCVFTVQARHEKYWNVCTSKWFSDSLAQCEFVARSKLVACQDSTGNDAPRSTKNLLISWLPRPAKSRFCRICPARSTG